MRLSMTSLVVAGIVALPLTAWSQGPGNGDTTMSRDQDRAQDCTGFVDADGDGLCDLCGGDHTPDQTRDRDQDGTGDCTGFVDADGDGLCDLCGGDHTPDQTRDRDQTGDCAAFVDEDGDGICDLCLGEHAGAGPESGEGRRFMRGDVDGDGRRGIGDPIRVLGCIFGNEQLLCQDAADANDDGSVDVSDPVRLLFALFCGQGEIPAPFRNAGNDPTPDDLGCQ
jgi:hypothetical protein